MAKGKKTQKRKNDVDRVETQYEKSRKSSLDTDD